MILTLILFSLCMACARTGSDANNAGSGLTGGYAISASGDRAMALHWGADKIFGYDLNLVDGSLSRDQEAKGNYQSQEAIPHPGGRYVYVLSYESQTPGIISLYAFGADHSINKVSETPVGRGRIPTGLILSPDGAYAYVLEAQGFGSTHLVLYLVEPTTGELKRLSTLVDFEQDILDMVMHPSGKFLYLFNAEMTGVQVVELLPLSAAATLKSTATFPQIGGLIRFTADGKRAFAAPKNHRLLEVYSFQVDLGTGAFGPLKTHAFDLSQAIAERTYFLRAPSTVAIDPTGEFLVVVWGGAAVISVARLSVTHEELVHLSDLVLSIDDDPPPQEAHFHPTGKFVYLTFWGPCQAKEPRIDVLKFNPEIGELTAQVP